MNIFYISLYEDALPLKNHKKYLYGNGIISIEGQTHPHPYIHRTVEFFSYTERSIGGNTFLIGDGYGVKVKDPLGIQNSI